MHYVKYNAQCTLVTFSTTPSSHKDDALIQYDVQYLTCSQKTNR